MMLRTGPEPPALSGPQTRCSSWLLVSTRPRLTESAASIRYSRPVSRQDAPGVARADSHQFSRLIQGNVLGEKAVQNLESRLFFGIQSHILHGVNVTFMLAS